MSKYFESPSFSDGIPSRLLRNRLSLLRTANDAGLIPPAEWEAIKTLGMELCETNPERLFECLDQVDVEPGRKGSDTDKKLHYSVELWRKAKGLNRGRSVLGCALAHLIAMKRLVSEGYDFILEDNVRAPTGRSGGSGCAEDDDGADPYCECAERLWNSIEASVAWEKEDAERGENIHSQKCHLRYYGWLGSVPNLGWVFDVHIPRTRYRWRDDGNGSGVGSRVDGGPKFSFPPSARNRVGSVFPFPNPIDMKIDEDAVATEGRLEQDTDDKTEGHVNGDDPKDASDTAANDGSSGAVSAKKPGGSPIWGAYAYWISPVGHEALLSTLRQDVGALLWKGKRMRCHVVKPIDKVLPRGVMRHFGPWSVHVSTSPAFFRAPMLTSKIHSQWDAEFCRSTEYQMSRCCIGMDKRVNGLFSWDDLWLTEEERGIVHYRHKSGTWLPMDKWAMIKGKEGEGDGDEEKEQDDLTKEEQQFMMSIG